MNRVFRHICLFILFSEVTSYHPDRSCDGFLCLDKEDGKLVRLPEILPLAWTIIGQKVSGSTEQNEGAQHPFVLAEVTGMEVSEIVQQLVIIKKLHQFIVEGALLNSELNSLGGNLTTMIRSGSTWLSSRNVSQLLEFSSTCYSNSSVLCHAMCDTQAEGLLTLQRILISVLVLKIVILEADPGTSLSNLDFSWVPSSGEQGPTTHDNRCTDWNHFRSAFEFQHNRVSAHRTESHFRYFREWKKACQESVMKMVRTLREIPMSVRNLVSFRRDDVSHHISVMRHLLSRIRNDLIEDPAFRHESWLASSSVQDTERQRRHRFVTVHILHEQIQRIALSRGPAPQIFDAAGSYKPHQPLFDGSEPVAGTCEPRMFSKESNLFEKSTGVRTALKHMGMWDLYAPILQAVREAKHKSSQKGLGEEQWETECDPYVRAIYLDMVKKFVDEFGTMPDGLIDEPDETSRVDLSSPPEPVAKAAPAAAPPVLLSAPTARSHLEISATLQSQSKALPKLSLKADAKQPELRQPAEADAPAADVGSDVSGTKRPADADAEKSDSESALAKKLKEVAQKPVAKPAEKPAEPAEEEEEEHIGFPKQLPTSHTPPDLKEMSFSVTLERPYRVVPTEWKEAAAANGGSLFKYYHFEPPESDANKWYYDHIFLEPDNLQLDDYPPGCPWPGKSRATWDASCDGSRDLFNSESYQIPPPELQRNLKARNADLFQYQTDWFKWRLTPRISDPAHPFGVTKNRTLSIPRGPRGEGGTEPAGWDPQRHVCDVGFDIDDAAAEQGKRKSMKWSRAYADHPELTDEAGKPLKVAGWAIRTEGIQHPKAGSTKPRAIGTFVQDKLMFAGSGGFTKETSNTLSEAEKGHHQGKLKLEMANQGRINKKGSSSKGKQSAASPFGDKGKDDDSAASIQPSDSASQLQQAQPPQPDLAQMTQLPQMSSNIFQQFMEFSAFQAALNASQSSSGKGKDSWSKEAWKGNWGPWKSGKGPDNFGPYGKGNKW